MSIKTEKREFLSSRLGFLLISAGCAIGLGNVWKFPYITGRYGGALFLAAYLFFLLAVGLPIMIMEFAIGRASNLNMGKALRALEPEGTKWHGIGWFAYAGSMCLMMFYIPVAGWLVSYCWHMATGHMAGLTPEQVGGFFGGMLGAPLPMFGWTAVVLLIGFVVCGIGIQKGVERIVKILMIGLLLIMVALAVNSLTLSGAAEGLRFYLAPNVEKIREAGFFRMLNDAMSQAFFTLSLGIGSMLIFGSYLDKSRSLTGEALWICVLDTFVALTAGFIIFPACFTYNVDPGAGPVLVFITLPNIFNEMTGGTFWGTLFFIFMSVAALTTVITVVENIISYSTDVWGWSRKKSVWVNGIMLLVLTLPCILGFNVLSDIHPFGGESNLMDLEDFFLSYNLLPIGSFIMLLFCTWRYGWGFDKFIQEADLGEGLKFPRVLRIWLTYFVPLIIIFVFVQGYRQFF